VIDVPWRGADPACALAQAAAVVGDRWSLVVLRDVARGVHRFDALATELDISRKVLAQRLEHLVEHGVLSRTAYQDRPPRHDYRLTAAGEALLPVLVGLQDWGDQWVLGDGDPTATTRRGRIDHRRVHGLVGTQVPHPLVLPSAAGDDRDVVDPHAAATVLFTYPATGTPAPLPDDWSDVPGATGCTLENRLFRDSYDGFQADGVAVHGVSTQRPDEQRRFAADESIPFPLLSDEDLRFAAALRLPTLRAHGPLRLRRLVVVVGADREVLGVRYPVTDIADAIAWSRRTALRSRGTGRR
jgi:DNA-binding HxlR family transcriptional regulator/peroxiredoxin